MTVNPVAGSTSTAPTSAIQRKPEAAELNVGGDHDGDSDDGSTRSKVNASGQTLGQLVNTKA